jgi:aldehyde dehydrogenase (NAD+)
MHHGGQDRAPETALNALIFGEAAAEAGLPPGVLNIVAGG